MKEELDKTITGQMVSVMFQRGKSDSWTCGGKGELKGQRMIEDKQKAGREGREQSLRGRQQGLEDTFLFGMNSIKNYKATWIIHSWAAEDTKRCLRTQHQWGGEAL